MGRSLFCCQALRSYFPTTTALPPNLHLLHWSNLLPRDVKATTVTDSLSLVFLLSLAQLSRLLVCSPSLQCISGASDASNGRHARTVGCQAQSIPRVRVPTKPSHKATLRETLCPGMTSTSVAFSRTCRLLWRPTSATPSTPPPRHPCQQWSAQRSHSRSASATTLPYLRVQKVTSDTSVRMKPFHVGLIKTALIAAHDDTRPCDDTREVTVVDILQLSPSPCPTSQPLQAKLKWLAQIRKAETVRHPHRMAKVTHP